MPDRKTLQPLRVVVLVFAACFALRFVEYIFLQTDRGIVGEAVLHKLLGIAVLAVALKALHLTWPQIGFAPTGALRASAQGLLLGAGAFAAAYGAELMLLTVQGKSPALALYVSAYALDGNIGMRTGVGFYLLCVAGNVINVVMEEGVFRGLFMNLLGRRRSFLAAALISSALFGLWHVMAPLRSLMEGGMQLSSFFAASLLQILTTALMGFMLCLLVRVSGSLYMPMAAHFFNNTVVNILHVTTATGADELQFLRITIAQTITFLVALLLAVKSNAAKKTQESR